MITISETDWQRDGPHLGLYLWVTCISLKNLIDWALYIYSSLSKEINYTHRKPILWHFD